ncbi:MAG: nucleotide sugar dehydrogenase [Phycisphaeraceae bacterium]|nr:nucleotide sugar dehydrogenase [Phycisphaeraceae bacterium]MCW5753282.1 nucleotide sugar dehydrogenase [Phycisphaeraceae bacterium]
MPSVLDEFRGRVARREATVGVVGLGYVGLPIAGAMHDAGFEVIGFDVDAKKIEQLRRGEAYLRHAGEDLFRVLAGSGRFRPTTDPSLLSKADAILLCVPTPLGPHKEPDLSFVERSTAMAAGTLRRGQLIVLESTSYPGTTREVCLPIIEQIGRSRGLHVGKDWFLAFSPEREDPGRTSHTTRTTPRLVGGIDQASGEAAEELYRAAIDHVVAVSSAEVAEAAKLLENIYRAVNIALVNELKPVLASMGIDIWEVIASAATKPYGFAPFYPGPGLGGHCIPIDPFYLTWKAREFGHATRFIELAGEINASMPGRVVAATAEALNDMGKPLHGADVLVLGLAYKKNVDDVRETPAAEIIRELLGRHARVSYHDPHVAEFPMMRKYHFPLRSESLTPERLEQSDVVVIVTDHDGVDYDLVGSHAKLIVDTRNVMAKTPGAKAKVVKA